MDTFKEKQQLDDMDESGYAPWEVWKADGHGAGQLMSGLAFATERTAASSCSASAPTVTTSRSAAAARSSARSRTSASSGSRGWCCRVTASGLRSGAERSRPRRSAATGFTMKTASFRDGYFPYTAAPIKDFFESLKPDVQPDIVLTHYREDRHQDHRLVSD